MQSATKIRATQRVQSSKASSSGTFALKTHCNEGKILFSYLSADRELFCDEALDTQLKQFLAELKETPKP